MNNNTKQIRNLFTCRIQVIKLAAKEMRSAKFYAILLVSVMLAGMVSLLPAISSLTNNVIIENTGRMAPAANVTANSGSAEDIQAAADEAAAAGGGVVYIPEGEFNFVEVGDPWQTVTVPSRVSLFGAPTERTSDYPEPERGRSPNNQVLNDNWRTILKMPYDVPGGWHTGTPYWFTIVGDGVTPQRFSDIKLVGYRSIDPSSTTLHRGISITNVPNFRVDHCYFEHICGGVISVNGKFTHGVIDHCSLVNLYTYVVAIPWDACTAGYGVTVFRSMTEDLWDPTEQVLGVNTSYSTFIEDCYFTEWRHGVTSSNGAHWIYRYNTQDGGHGMGDIDAHGISGGQIVGTRAIEVYKNEFLNCLGTSGLRVVCQHRGGAGIYWDNFATPLNGSLGYSYLVSFMNEGSVAKCWPHDVYIWGNLGVDTVSVATSPGPVLGVDYFLEPMSGWSAYEYPHPLTLQG